MQSKLLAIFHVRSKETVALIECWRERDAAHFALELYMM